MREDLGVDAVASPIAPDQPAPLGNWQPIDTAPKNQRCVLLAYEVPGDDGIEIETGYGYWTGRGWWRATLDFNKGPMATYNDQEGFYCAWDFRAFATAPTHWMPLPAPPQAAAVEVEGPAR